MHTVFTFCVLAVFVIAVVEANFFPHVKEAESKVARFTHRLQTVSRARRQGPSTDCERAIERFESHAYSEECQYVFEDEHDFFDGLDDNYINKFCGRYNCSKWLPPIFKALDEECDYDTSALIGILSYSCDVDDETHDVCIKEWQRLGNASMNIDPHFHENFEMCANRTETCPQACKSALTYINNNAGCCYADLLEIDNEDLQNFLLGKAVFKECNMDSPRRCGK